MDIIIIFRILSIVFCACRFINLSFMQADDLQTPIVGIALFAVAIGGFYIYKKYQTPAIPAENPYWNRSLPNPYPPQVSEDRMPRYIPVVDGRESPRMHNDEHLDNKFSFVFLDLFKQKHNIVDLVVDPLNLKNLSVSDLGCYQEKLKYCLILQDPTKSLDISDFSKFLPNPFFDAFFLLFVSLALFVLYRYVLTIQIEHDELLLIAKQSSCGEPGGLPLEFAHQLLNLDVYDLDQVHKVVSDLTDWCYRNKKK